MNCINVWIFCQASPEGTRVTVQNSLPYMFSISPFQDHWPKWQSWMPESGANMSDTNAVIYVQNCVQHCGVGTVHTLCFPWFVKQNYTDTICIPRCTSEPCFSMNNSHRCNWSEGGRKTRVNWIIQCWTIAIAAATLNFRLCCQLANYLDSRLYSLQGDIYKKKQDGIDVSSFFLRLQRTNFFSLSSCGHWTEWAIFFDEELRLGTQLPHPVFLNESWSCCETRQTPGTPLPVLVSPWWQVKAWPCSSTCCKIGKKNYCAHWQASSWIRSQFELNFSEYSWQMALRTSSFVWSFEEKLSEVCWFFWRRICNKQIEGGPLEKKNISEAISGTAAKWLVEAFSQ